MPVDTSAGSTYVHLLELLDLSPAELTVTDEFFVLINHFRRNVRMINNAFSCFDTQNLLATEGTVIVMPPPCDQAVLTKFM